MAEMTKKVNVYPTANKYAITKTATDIIGTTLNVVLTVSDIKICLDCGAEVYEVLGKSKVIKLNYNNYNKDNGAGASSTNTTYEITTIKVVNDLPTDPSKTILYVKGNEGYIWNTTVVGWQLLVRNVSTSILDTVSDPNSAASVEAVKKYVTDKLKNIGVAGAGIKITATDVDKVLVADAEGEVVASTQKIGADTLSATDDDKLATEKAVKNAVSWIEIN